MKCPRPRKCKQLLLKLGVFLLLGAIVNVAVAWVCSWVYSPRERTELSRREAEILVFPDTVPPARDWDFRSIQWASVGFLVSSVTARWLKSDAKHIYDYSALHDSALQAGWPWLSMAGWIRRSDESGTIAEHCIVCNDCAIPYKPLLPGFAINTIFYAAILWMLWIARRTPGKIRRFIRVHRGRCPACGYIIAPGTSAASGGGGPCSECGAASPRQMRGEDAPAR